MGYSLWGCKELDTTEQLTLSLFFFPRKSDVFNIAIDLPREFRLNVLQFFSHSRLGLSHWLRDKESTCQCRRRGFDPWVGKIPWRRGMRCILA